LTILSPIRLISYYPIINGVVLLLGVARELVVSSHYGLSSEIDIYVAVVCFHQFFGVQVGNATESVFISKAGILSSVALIRDQLVRFFKDLVWFNLMTLPLILIFSGKILHVIVPGFTESQIEKGQSILNLIILSTIAANLSAVFRAALNIRKIFLPGFAAGGIVSVSIILAVFLFEERVGIYAIPAGFVAGHIVVLAIYSMTWYGIWRSQSAECQPKKEFQNIPSLSKAVGIVLISEILYQFFTVTQRGFSSEIAPGTIAAFFYTEVLVAVPSALFATPLSTLLFPRLAKAFSIHYQKGNRMLLQYGGGIFIASLVLAVAVTIFSEFIVSAVFMRGRFTVQDSSRTAELLGIMILALPFMNIGNLLRYALYSMSNYKASIYSNGLMWLVFALVGFWLVPHFGAVGLAWATVVGIVSQTISMLIVIFMKKDDRAYANP
jgi:putative peptidoglycan lipid II flippase